MLLLLCAIGCAPAALAWGGTGHSIVAEIAQRTVAAETRRAIAALIGDGASLASLSAWAESVTEQRPQTRPWHFVNIPYGAQRYEAERDCPKGRCVVGAIERFRATLADRGASREARREALAFLVHLVADAHQPMHCVQRDGGGSTLQLSFRGRQTTLHKLWDFELLDAWSHDWGEHLSAIQTVKVQDRSPAPDDPAAWVTDCHRLAVDVAYVLQTGDVIDPYYEFLARPVIYSQLGLAGLRLARLLDAALK
jgi:nuclease S1